MPIEFSKEQMQTLAVLDFTPVLRCDDRTVQVKCQDQARLGFRCFGCDEMSIFCPAHAQRFVSAVVVHCARCRRTGRASIVFGIEPL